MRREAYLLEALRHGLMFTDHEVRFQLTDNREEMEAMFCRIEPILMRRLEVLGCPFRNLPEDRRLVLFHGIGTIRAVVPMICFTEVPPGRDIHAHRESFGGFALVVRAPWLLRNGGDRVVYVGEGSPVSRQLHLCLAIMRIFGIHTLADGTPVFEGVSTQAAIDLVSFVEARAHLEQAEWRIAGLTGFFGEKRSTGSRVCLGMSDIEHVFAPGQREVALLRSEVSRLAAEQETDRVPVVSLFPRTIPE